MAINSKLFFQNTDGWANNFPYGGVPILNGDIKALENTSKLYGAWAIANKWNVIIQGCEVDELNLTTKTVKINAGYFIINGIMYYTEGFTSTFPCALVAGVTEIDTRAFKNGNIEDVATTFYSSVITTGFNPYNDIFGTNPSSTDLKPSNLSNCIFFDPYTHQRLEFLLANQSKGLNEKRIGEFKLAFSKTETLKNQIGGACNENTSLNKGRWKYYGYEFETAEYFPFIGNGTPSITSGSFSITLTPANLPSHNHPVNLTTDVAGDHVHPMSFSGDNSLDTNSQFVNGRNNPDVNMGTWATAWMRSAGNHGHNVNGNTGNNAGTATPLIYKPVNQIVHSIKWKGYTTTDSYFIKNMPMTNR